MKLKLIFFLLLSCLPAFSQAGRFDSNVFTAAGNVPFGAQAPMYTVPFSKVYICANPATGAPCTNTVSIFSDSALTQQILNPITTDAQGRFGFWIESGTYQYSIVSAIGEFLGTNTFSVQGAITQTGTVSSVGLTLPVNTFAVGSPVTSSGNLSGSYINQNPNTFLRGPASGAAAGPGWGVLASEDFAAALASDPTLTIVSATMNNTGTITTGNLIVSGDLAYHTDCSAAGNNSFAFGFISNGVFGGPLLATVATSGVCPPFSDYSIAGWATDTLSVQDGGGILSSNCGANSSCPSTSPGLSQQANFVPSVPSGTCPGTPFPGPTNQPQWAFVAVGTDGKPHIYTCTNLAGATWALLI